LQERKEEHVGVLEELRAQGFVRARIDGSLVGTRQLPTWSCGASTASTWWTTASGARRPGDPSGGILRTICACRTGWRASAYMDEAGT